MVAVTVAATVVALTASALPAWAQFPYGSGPDYKVPPGTVPNDLSGDYRSWIDRNGNNAQAFNQLGISGNIFEDKYASFSIHGSLPFLEISVPRS